LTAEKLRELRDGTETLRERDGTGIEIFKIWGSNMGLSKVGHVFFFCLFDTIAPSFEIRYDGVLDGNNTPLDSIEVFGFSSKTVIRVFFLLTIDSKSEIFLMTAITSKVVLTLMFGKCFNSTNLCLSFGKEMF
jgi:hypothetical protein